MTPVPASDPHSARMWAAAYDYHHDYYQAYYAAGLRAALDRRGVRLDVCQLHRADGFLSVVRRVRHSYRLSGVMRWGGTLMDGAAGLIAGRRKPPSGRFHPLAGQYEFRFLDGRTVRLVVDASDAGEVVSADLLDRCDVYAKTHFRADQANPRHVAKLVNGNPVILPHLDLLSGLRTTTWRYDLCCVIRVRGGRNEVAGVEHNLRLIEAANRAKGRKFLLAYLVGGEVAAQERRLRDQSIPTTRSPLPLRELWATSAASKVNIIRLGMHNCVPWRMADLLAMGACIALDQPPQALWPAPLVAGEHYANLGVPTSPEGGVAPDETYRSIPDRLDRIAADSSEVERLRRGAASYFDSHANPAAVGEYLFGLVREAHRSGGRLAR